MFLWLNEKFQLGVPFAGKYKEILNSDDVRFGGSGMVNPRVKTSKKEEWDARENSIVINLAPLSVCVFQCTPEPKEAKSRRSKNTAVGKSAAAGKDAAAGKNIAVGEGSAEGKNAAEEKNTVAEKAASRAAKVKQAVDGGRIGTGQESGGSEAGHSRSGVAAGEKGGGSETGGKGSRGTADQGRGSGKVGRRYDLVD